MVKTVYEQFRAAADANPDLPFLHYPACAERGYLATGRTFSYGEALELTDDLAARYLAAGYGPGYRVALLIGNRPMHFWHLLALNCIGASAVPINPDYRAHEMQFAIEFAECALVAADGPQLDDLRSVCAKLSPAVPVFHDTGETDAIPPPARTMEQDVPGDPGEREALIIYTSGTTGHPKGCMISNTSCLAAGESYGTAGGLIDFRTGEDRLYIPLPAFHMNVSVYTLNTMTRLRNCIVLQDRFRASSWWQDIVESEATCVHYMGIIPPLLVKAPPSSLDRAHSVRFGQGAGVDPSVRDAFEARFGFPLIEAWGMTETSRAIQNCRLPRDPAGRAFGIPRPPLEVYVSDDAGNPLPADTPGELMVRAMGDDPRHGFFSGYLNQPEETERAWAGGWFHTGDIVTQRADGMLSFVDRKKNIIRRSGENIAAAEIEEALIEHSFVRSVAVLAVDDEFHDEEIMACIVPMTSQDGGAEAAEGIVDWARDRLARHKLPGWICFVDEVPVTGTQKIQKGAIFDKDSDPRQDPCSIDTRALKRRPATT